MKILILCDRKSDFMQGALRDLLTKAGHGAETVTLNGDEIKPCVGCFGCWSKTPGQCVMTGDAANRVAAQEMRADAVVLLSEITYGGFSADVKAFLDRSIQNVMPFFEIYQGEVHHTQRYEHFPIWIALGHGGDESERRTFLKLAERNARNIRPRKHLPLTLRDGDELAKKAPAILKFLEEAGS